MVSKLLPKINLNDYKNKYKREFDKKIIFKINLYHMFIYPRNHLELILGDNLPIICELIVCTREMSAILMESIKNFNEKT